MISEYFTVGNNYKNVYKTLGPFWDIIFKDKRFIGGVTNSQCFSIDEISDNISKVNISLNESKCPEYLLNSTYRVSVPSTNITPQLYKVSDAPKLYTEIFLVGQVYKNISYVVKLPKKINNCAVLANTIEFNDIVLLKDIDYTQLDSETLVLKHTPEQYGFQYEFNMSDSGPIKTYILYIRGSYSGFGYSSRFGKIPSVTYKNDLVYDLLTNEATYSKFIQTVQKAIGITVPTVDGVITRIWYEGAYTMLYNGSIIKIPNRFTPIVSIGDRVAPNSILIKEINFVDDITKSSVRYYYVPPEKLPITKYGISIPNSNIPILYGDTVYLSTENNDEIIATEADDELVTESSSNYINLGIQGTEEDVSAFYTTLESGLLEYSVSLPSVITSSNPTSIIFRDIHNIQIPTFDITASVLYSIDDLNSVVNSLHGMSLPSTDFLINSTISILDKPIISVQEVEDQITCFIVYDEITDTQINLDDTRHTGDVYL